MTPMKKRPPAFVVFALAAFCGCRGSKDIVWSFTTPRPWVLAGDSQALTPAINGNVVFFCGGYAAKKQSQIYALDLQTGKPKWQRNVGSCTSAPLVSAETVIVFAFAEQSDRIVVYGLDKDSGSQKWKVELPGNPHPPAPVVVGNFVFFAPGSRSILRMDAGNGSVQTFDMDADLSVPAENLWVTSALGAAIFGYGKSYWRSRINTDILELGPPLSEPAGRPIGLATDGSILVFGDDEGNLRVFDLGKGRVIWRHHWNKILSAPSLGDGRVFLNVYQQKNELIALALGSGDELWRIQAGGIYVSFWDGGRVYTSSGSAALVVDGASGRTLSRFAASTEITTTPMPAGDVILFGSARGVLYAAKASR
jgi:outer membrane protein assembly factor BamB